MHQSIADNIAYWSQPQFLQGLADDPPFHTSYYCVDEDGVLRVYGVKWQGADLSQGELFTPENEHDLMADVAPLISKGKGHGAAIGEGFTSSKGLLMVCDCYVFDSPIRKQKRWLASYAGSYLREQIVKPQAYSFKLNKEKWAVRFINETEKEVTVLVEPK